MFKQKVQAEGSSRRFKQKVQAEGSMTKLRFLLLEDSPADVELLATTLDNSDLDCEFTVVETQEDFQQVLQSRPIDIVLADYSLPTFNGMEAIRIVSAQFPQIPCILVSDVMGEERAIEALKSGAANYVLKKRLERLVPAVKRALKETQEQKLLARATAELKKNEARFRTSVEAMADCLVILSAVRSAQGMIQDFAVEYINEMARQYLSISVDEQIGHSIYRLIPGLRDTSESHFFTELCFVADGGRPYQKEICLGGYNKQDEITSDQFVAIEVSAAKLDDGLVMTWRDITQRKKLEQQRIQLLEEAEASRTQAIQSNQRKDEFLASFSHELRSPISNISAWLQLLETNRKSAELGHKALEVIQSNAKLLERLAGDLLDSSRIAQGKFDCGLEVLNLHGLNQIILEAVDAVEPISHHKAIRVVFAPFQSLGQFSGDAVRLHQVIQNLLSNAIKFTPSQGLVSIDVSQQSGTLLISVTDTGKGMSPSEISHIFEPFWQAKNESSRTERGMGLGLSIAKHIIETHGGRITAKSIGPGEGSVFTVELPLLIGEGSGSENMTNDTVVATTIKTALNTKEQPATIDDSPDSSTDGHLRNVRVLVVDDQADSLNVCKMMLEIHGAKVEGATTAAEAIEALKQFHPSVLVSDIGMPDTNGYELIRQIRRLPEDDGGLVPAIALSSYTQELDRTRALLAGFQLHIAKPVDFEGIVKSVALLALHPRSTDVGKSN